MSKQANAAHTMDGISKARLVPQWRTRTMPLNRRQQARCSPVRTSLRSLKGPLRLQQGNESSAAHTAIQAGKHTRSPGAACHSCTLTVGAWGQGMSRTKMKSIKTVTAMSGTPAHQQ